MSLVVFLFITCLSVAFSQTLYQNMLSSPSLLPGGRWNPITQQGADASFNFDSSGFSVDILNIGMVAYSVQLENGYGVGGNRLYLTSGTSYVLIADMKTNSVNRDVYFDVDSDYPNYQSLISGGSKQKIVTSTWTNYSVCFVATITDSNARVVFSFGHTTYNPSEGLHIRFCNLIPVSSCAATTGITQLESSEDSRSSKGAVYAGVGVVIGAIAIAGAVVLIFFVLRRKKSPQSIPNIELRGTNYRVFTTNSTNSMNLIKKESVRAQGTEIGYHELKFLEQIGGGAFGIVFKGQWRHQLVAIKQIRSDLLNSDDVDSFREETAVMLSIRPHKNVLLLLGVCTEEIDKLCIVTEFCKEGSIEKYLKTHNPSKVERLQWIKGIAAGMAHLAREGVVHRDLSARNVLLDGMTPKIADFGLSRIISDESSVRFTSSNIGPIKWMAPESIEFKQYSQKSDVWMFGCAVYEIIYGEPPYGQQPPVEAAVQVVRRVLCPTIPPKEEWGIVSDMMASCFKFDAKLRPTFEDICKRFAV